MPDLPYLTPEVRDLAWLLLAPGLLRHGALGREWPLADEQAAKWGQNHAPLLAEWDHKPQPLIDWLHHRRRPRLGHYAEDLILWWLRHCPQISAACAGLAVTAEDGATLGEIDFLFCTGQRQVTEHWEIAVKCYLRSADQSGQCLGPGGRDQLATKIERLRHHQLPLVQHPRAQIAIAQAGFTAPPAASRALVKGWIFHPLGQDRPQPLASTQQSTYGVDELAPDHMRGWWAFEQDWKPDHEPRNARFAVVPKARWLAPLLLAPNNRQIMARKPFEALVRQSLHRQQRPEMVATLVPDLAGNWQERHRGFVVPPSWPRAISGNKRSEAVS